MKPVQQPTAAEPGAGHLPGPLAKPSLMGCTGSPEPAGTGRFARTSASAYDARAKPCLARANLAPAGCCSPRPSWRAIE